MTADLFYMSAVFRLVGACVLATGLASAEPPGWACATEVLDLHGVWQTRQNFLPVYSDFDLVWYLAELLPVRGEILPVYSSDPIAFRRGKVVFVSTGLLLSAHSEGELLARLKKEANGLPARGPGERAPGVAGCTPLAPLERMAFADLQKRLSAQVHAYAESRRVVLKRRDWGN